MTTQQEPSARPQRPRPVMRRVEVAGVEHITPHMVRVSLTGEGLRTSPCQARRARPPVPPAARPGRPVTPAA